MNASSSHALHAVGRQWLSFTGASDFPPVRSGEGRFHDDPVVLANTHSWPSGPKAERQWVFVPGELRIATCNDLQFKETNEGSNFGSKIGTCLCQAANHPIERSLSAPHGRDTPLALKNHTITAIAGAVQPKSAAPSYLAAEGCGIIAGARPFESRSQMGRRLQGALLPYERNR